eukprot:596489-Rhodomonas_salina.1
MVLWHVRWAELSGRVGAGSDKEMLPFSEEILVTKSDLEEKEQVQLYPASTATQPLSRLIWTQRADAHNRFPGRLVPGPEPACVGGMRCAVLRGVRYRASVWCYVVCGTELAYGAMARAVLSWRMVLPAHVRAPEQGGRGRAEVPVSSMPFPARCAADCTSSPCFSL